MKLNKNKTDSPDKKTKDFWCKYTPKDLIMTYGGVGAFAAVLILFFVLVNISGSAFLHSGDKYFVLFIMLLVSAAVFVIYAVVATVLYIKFRAKQIEIDTLKAKITETQKNELAKAVSDASNKPVSFDDPFDKD